MAAKLPVGTLLRGFLLGESALFMGRNSARGT